MFFPAGGSWVQGRYPTGSIGTSRGSLDCASTPSWVSRRAAGPLETLQKPAAGYSLFRNRARRLSSIGLSENLLEERLHRVPRALIDRLVVAERGIPEL